MNQIKVFPTPIKSEGDKKEYRLIQLPNKVKALLISSASTSSDAADNENLAAANITINVGSYDNPPKVLGLAHFLEHMVHMGSEKYPGESSYYDFLAANGGKRNALTASEYTSYYFGVSENAFPEAVDRLEQLIEKPLLVRSAMQREREAVDSEYELKKSIDAVRLESIMKTLVRDGHQAGLFDFGNLKTLKDDITDDDLHSELMKFHKRYVGNKIVVAVQSKRTLDELQAIVVSSFSSIESGVDEGDKQPHNTNDIFKPEFHEKIYFLKPKTAKNVFTMTWIVPSAYPHYKCSPLDYVSSIISNEGEGGIATYLKEKHLITSIGTYSDTNTVFTAFKLYGDLTKLGSKNIEKVLEAIFDYLLMIKETPMSEHRRVYADLVERTKLEYNLHQESAPMSNIQNVTKNLLFFDDIDAVRGESIYQKFDEKSIVDYIDALSQRKFSLTFLLENHENYDMREKYFGTEYSVESFPEAYQRLWDERKLNPAFHIEKPNPFKPSNLEIFKNDQESPDFPVKIYENLNITAWHKLDKKFQRPHVHFKIQMNSTSVSTLKDLLALRIYAKVLDFHLEKKISQAINAGYRVNMSTNINGFGLNFNGYNDKLSLLIDMVTDFLKKCVSVTNEGNFKAIKEDLKQGYSERLLNQFGGLNAEYFTKALLKRHHTSLELYHEADNFTLEDLEHFSTKFFKKLSIEILVQGNMTRSQTLSVIEIVKTNLNVEPLSEDMELKQRCYQVPFGTTTLRIKSLQANDDNSYIKNFYQIGRDTIHIRDLTRLIEMILNPKAYDYLRTKEQLGYGVACQMEEKGGLIGISIIVLSQENKNSYKKVIAKMDHFMNEIAKKTIEELTDDEFMKFKDARIKRLLAEDLDLNTEVAKSWNEIKEHDFIFERYELSADDTRTITKSDLQDFFESFTQFENMRLFSVQVIGNPTTSGGEPENAKRGDLKLELLTEKLHENENLITDIEHFRKDLFLHPVVREVAAEVKLLDSTSKLHKASSFSYKTNA